MPQKTALVTGATGFIGSRLAESLIGEGWALKLLVRNPDRLSPLLKQTEIITGDLADLDALARAVQSVSVVFHCAANVHTWDTQAAYRAANVTGVENLLTAIAQENSKLSRLVHVSTVDVYGFPTQPCDETAPTQESGFGYGDSKREGENIVRRLCGEQGIPFTILRPCNVIGPRSPFVERIGKELRAGLMVTIDGGKANAGLIHVSNLVDDMIWVAHAPQAMDEIYNLRDPYDASWADFVFALRRGIKGHGVVLNLPFGVADLLGRGFERGYAVLRLSQEPLLHRLIVRLFGRSCGHSAAKIAAHRGPSTRIGFAEAIEDSSRWFLEQKKRVT